VDFLPQSPSVVREGGIKFYSRVAGFNACLKDRSYTGNLHAKECVTQNKRLAGEEREEKSNSSPYFPEDWDPPASL